jgi:hypothetical protein
LRSHINALFVHFVRACSFAWCDDLAKQETERYWLA